MEKCYVNLVDILNAKTYGVAHGDGDQTADHLINAQPDEHAKYNVAINYINACSGRTEELLPLLCVLKKEEDKTLVVSIVRHALRHDDIARKEESIMLIEKSLIDADVNIARFIEIARLNCQLLSETPCGLDFAKRVVLVGDKRLELRLLDTSPNDEVVQYLADKCSSKMVRHTARTILASRARNAD